MWFFLLLVPSIFCSVDDFDPESGPVITTSGKSAVPVAPVASTITNLPSPIFQRLHENEKVSDLLRILAIAEELQVLQGAHYYLRMVCWQAKLFLKDIAVPLNEKSKVYTEHYDKLVKANLEMTNLIQSLKLPGSPAVLPAVPAALPAVPAALPATPAGTP